jgi:hypothetical protein
LASWACLSISTAKSFEGDGSSCGLGFFISLYNGKVWQLLLTQSNLLMSVFICIQRRESGKKFFLWHSFMEDFRDFSMTFSSFLVLCPFRPDQHSKDKDFYLNLKVNFSDGGGKQLGRGLHKPMLPRPPILLHLLPLTTASIAYQFCGHGCLLPNG